MTFNLPKGPIVVSSLYVLKCCNFIYFNISLLRSTVLRHNATIKLNSFFALIIE